MLSERSMLLVLFSIAFGLRILFAALIGTQPQITPNPTTPDVKCARQITGDIGWIKEPFSPRAPAYPMLLAAIFALFGDRLWPALIVQAILGALTVLVVYRMGERLAGRTVGLLSALWLSLYVHHLYYSSVLHRDILACLLLVLLFGLLSRTFSQMRYSVFSGVVYAALVHVDPQYFILFPVIAVFVLAWATRHFLLNLQYFFVLCGTLIVVSLPWTLRNYAVYKQFVPVSLEASHYFQPHSGGASDVSASSAEAGEAVRRPSRVRQIGENAREFWRITRFKRAAREKEETARPLEQGWSLRHNLINIISFGLLLPFFLIGVFLAFRERNRTGILIGAVIFLYFIWRSYFGASDRDRLPIEPLVIILALYGICRLVGSFRKQAEAT